MANFCNYEVHVRGAKKAAYMVYASMPCLDHLEIESESGTNEKYEIVFKGNCKWSVNFGVKDKWTGAKINLTPMSLDKIAQKGAEYCEYSLRVKSQVFNCDILCHYWSEESGFDQFDQYRNGQIVKKRKIAYNYDKENIFDWKKTEFIGHEGEYDESVDGEEQDANMMSSLMGALGMLGAVTTSQPQGGVRGAISGLEKELYLYFQDGDKFQNAKTTAKDFPGKSVKEIENALNSLCEKGYFYYLDTIIGGTYGIDSSLSPIFADDNDDTDEDIDAEELHARTAELIREADDLLGQLKDAGLVPGDENYVWTFDKKERASAPEWSITLPDGFVKIKSEEGRAFEAVPKGYEKNPEDAPVRILPGQIMKSPITKDLWFFDHRARKGLALQHAVILASAVAKLGLASDIAAESFGDIFAFMSIYTDDSSYSLQCSVYSGEKIYEIRFQTGMVLEPQKELLIASVFDMLKTFKANDKVSFVPKEPAIASQKVLDELKQGKTGQFEKAVELALNEYKCAHNGHSKAFEYRLNNGYLEKEPEIALKEMLSDCLPVLEFYYKKADELVEKLIRSGVDADTMKKVYAKLKDLDIPQFRVNLSGKTVEVRIPSAITDIKKKWLKDKIALTEREKEEEKQKKSQEEQEKKAYEKAHDEWKKNVQKAETNRKNELDRIKKEQQKTLTDAAEKKYSEKRAAAEKKKNAAEKKKAEAEKALAELGAFKFSEKRAQKALIAEAEEELAAASKELSEAKAEKEDALSKAAAKAERFVESKKAAVEEKYPLPEEPIFVSYKERKRQEELKRKGEEILAEMKLNEQYRVSTMCAEFACLADRKWNTSVVNSILTDLVKENRVSRYMLKGIAYYFLK